MTISHTLNRLYNLLVFSDLNSKMPHILKQFPQFNQEQVENIAEQCDPTDNKVYITWILKILENKSSTFPEDSDKIRESLEQFNLIKNKQFFTHPKEILKYDSQSELYGVLRLYDNYLQDIQEKLKLKKQEEILDKHGYIEVYNKEPFKILKVAKTKNIPTAMEFAKETNWCVRGEAQARHYLEMGPLYFVYKNNERYALLHVESKQLKYTNDRELKKEDRLELQPIFTENNIVHNIMYEWSILNNQSYRPDEKEMNYIRNDGKLSLFCARNIFKDRFPEGEDAICRNGDSLWNYYSFLRDKNIEIPEKIKEAIPKKAKTAYQYAFKIQQPYPEGEAAIATSPEYSYKYAKNILKPKRFELGEKAISTSAEFSCKYATDVLGGNRFELGEKTIATSSKYSYEYARSICKGRFELGEDVICKDDHFLWEYIQHLSNHKIEIPEKVRMSISLNSATAYNYSWITKKPYPEGEAAIATSPKFSYKYANDVLRPNGIIGFPLGEKAIATDAEYSCLYATYVLQNNFKLGEPIIIQDPKRYITYCLFLLKNNKEISDLIKDEIHKYNETAKEYVIKTRKPFPEGEAILSTQADSAIIYSGVIKDRFLLGEDTIFKSKAHSGLYISNLIKDKIPLFDKVFDMIKDIGILRYVSEFLIVPAPEIEPLILTDALCSLNYAKNAIRGRFLPGEEIIMKDDDLAKKYISMLGENNIEIPNDLIRKNDRLLYSYHNSRLIQLRNDYDQAFDDLIRDGSKSLPKEKEKEKREKIFKEISYKYQEERDKSIEEISKNAYCSITYAYMEKNKKTHYSESYRFELGEPAIATNAEYSYNYAKDIIDDRFPLGENAIFNNKNIAEKYVIFLVSKNINLLEENDDCKNKIKEIVIKILNRFDKKFKKIRQEYRDEKGDVYNEGFLSIEEYYKIFSNSYVYNGSQISYWYANNVLGSRFLEGEDAIVASGSYSSAYAQNVLKQRFERGEEAIINDNNDGDTDYYYAIFLHSISEDGRIPEDFLNKIHIRNLAQLYVNEIIKIEDLNLDCLMDLVNDNYSLKLILNKDPNFRINSQIADLLNPEELYHYIQTTYTVTNNRYPDLEDKLDITYRSYFSAHYLKQRMPIELEIELFENANKYPRDFVVSYLSNLTVAGYDINKILDETGFHFENVKVVRNTPVAPVVTPNLQQPDIQNITPTSYTLNRLYNLLVLSDLRTKLPHLLKQFPQFDERQIEEIVLESDPTRNKVYIAWILKQIIKRFLIFPEDSTKTKKLLSTFELLKTKRYFKEPKDINQYNSLSELYDAIELYKEHLNDINRKQQYNEEKKVLDTSGYIEVYNKQPFRILKVISIPVAMELAENTNWCVKEEKNAIHYLDQGPLYFIYKNNHEYALLHVESNQLKYTNDHELNMEDRLELEPIFVNNGIINNISYKYMILEDYKYKPTKSEINYIASNAKLSYRYAYIIGGRFELGEKAITTNAEYSYYYARDMLKPLGIHRFELAEKAIATSAEYSYYYAKDIIEERFELGEKAIATDAECSYLYALEVLNPLGIKRFKLGEPTIATDIDYSYDYARDVLKGRFELGEPTIATDAGYSYLYVRDVLKGRFELGEKTILKSTHKDVYLEFLKKNGYDIDQILEENGM